MASSLLADATPTLEKQILSPTYVIQKKYRSMEGPGSQQMVYLGDQNATPELLWITGVRTEMVSADGKTPQLPELMCHVNVDIDGEKHRSLFGFKRGVGSRVVTLSQGMLSAQLPEGFGFPISSNEPLLVYTQVLNHNIDNPDNIKVRHRVTVNFVRDRDLAAPIKPLFNVGASGTVFLDENTASPMTSAAPVPAPPAHGTSCLLLPRAPNAALGGSDYKDPEGRKLTGHWVVPPGKQVNHSDITWFLQLPYDTRLHYAAVHVHPFAKSVAFRDMTANMTLFTSKARGPAKGVGLTHVDAFTSAVGLRLWKDHKYELVSVYENPTSDNHDSMVSVFLGLEDPEWRKPTPEEFAARATEVFGPVQQAEK